MIEDLEISSDLRSRPYSLASINGIAIAVFLP
jgi:hypothetical protein